jgi:hypothetical protein
VWILSLAAGGFFHGTPSPTLVSIFPKILVRHRWRCPFGQFHWRTMKKPTKSAQINTNNEGSIVGQ